MTGSASVALVSGSVSAFLTLGQRARHLRERAQLWHLGEQELL
jgi:hypothetical protein